MATVIKLLPSDVAGLEGRAKRDREAELICERLAAAVQQGAGKPFVLEWAEPERNGPARYRSLGALAAEYRAQLDGGYGIGAIQAGRETILGRMGG